MSFSPGFDVPIVTDDDIAWACHVLQLPANAFSGSDGNDPRLGILKSNETLDIEACPGSGKTTLLVAKLAILARKWTATGRGICVLSHTNVARREIENRLGSTLGSKVLSHPHFVGTIHGFVNEFLAMPWLRSKGLPVVMVDDQIATLRRWKALPFNTRVGLEKNSYDPNLLRMASTDFTIGDIRWGKGTLGKTTATYIDIQAACRKTCEEGFFCYDEMFLWAHELLSKVPSVRSALRRRFPIVFFDEVQDNSELQSSLLFNLLIDGKDPVIRQRFGDTNQAIYQNTGSAEGATTDSFPQPLVRRDIPNSYRFGQGIGDLADPLAVDPQGLIGLGPSRRRIAMDTTGQSTIFLFSSDTIGNVLGSYARSLTEVFSTSDLRAGVFTAVGAIHRPAASQKSPASLGNYCGHYDHELTTIEARPSTFLRYLTVGRSVARTSGEAQALVEKTAEAILRLADVSGLVGESGLRVRKHRHVLRLLAEKPEARKKYQELIAAVTVQHRDTPIEKLSQEWSQAAMDIVAAIVETPKESDETKAFLATGDEATDDATPTLPRAGENVFLYPAQTPLVRIRMGSIHSVKGETHTATLVVDTFYYQHHLLTLKPWLLGNKAGAANETKRNVSRLRQHYVAMTRPSHMLCLAMREDGFVPHEITQLKNRGWRVVRVTDSASIPL